MESIRAEFEKAFGEDQAAAIWDAAISHKNGVHDREGSDPFKWALLIAIGYKCMEKDEFRGYHGITAPWDKLKLWIKENAKLDSYDGDFDYICAFAGGYNEYMPQKEEAACSGE